MSETLAPRAILTGVKMDLNFHCKILFGDYAQDYEKAENCMTERTVGTIYLGPTYNIKGGYKYDILKQGKG